MVVQLNGKKLLDYALSQQAMAEVNLKREYFLACFLILYLQNVLYRQNTFALQNHHLTTDFLIFLNLPTFKISKTLIWFIFFEIYQHFRQITHLRTLEAGS